ncbi:MAG: GAF domain-containing protein, partial [Maribacter sp.]|nr:GAF domain-containing protein [Maribacter sp.]
GPLETKVPIIKNLNIDHKEVAVSEALKVGEGKDVKLEMTTVTYPSDDVNYRYRLFKSNTPIDEIEDVPWITSETSNIMPKDIAPGNYRLWIQAQKEGGYSWSKSKKVLIRISKKWHTTWWGILFQVILGLLLFWYFARRWLLKRIRNLQNLLNQKEVELASQSTTLKDRDEEIKSTGTNIYLLQRLIRQIPKNASWKDTMPVLKKLVNLPVGIHAFEFAFKKGEEINYWGYKHNSNETVRRQEEFNEKNNLASYAIVTGKPIFIDDYNKEASQYITGKSKRGYASRMLLPFQQKKGTMAVFCVYNKEKAMFSQHDSTLLQILISFLSVSTKDELK